MKMYLRQIISISVIAGGAAAQSGGPFQITQSVTANGAAAAAGGIFAASVTIGQPVTGSQSGGIFGVTGGFWALSDSAASVTISGQVRSDTARFVKNSQVRITGGTVDRTIVSGPSGRFTFADIPNGNTYIVQVISRRFTYAPVMLVVNGNVSGLIIDPQ